MPKKLLPLLFLVTLSLGFTGGVYYQKIKLGAVSFNPFNIQDATAPQNTDFSLLWQVWNAIHDRYVDREKLKDQDLIFGAISGLVSKVGDPYTSFFPPQESENFSQEINGSFGGIGIEIGIRNEALTVITPIKDTPADRAGLRAGDKIVKIADKSASGLPINEAVAMIRGKIGTPINLTYTREGNKDPKEVTMVRETIKISAVKWNLLKDNTAHIQIFAFNKNVDQEFKKAADEIVNSKATRIILDMRGNPGGLLDSAINIASFFLEPNKTVTIERFGNGKENEFKTNNNAILKKYPLVILINKGSASASEILAGALKDQENITIIGEKSFGKGSVQEVIDLPYKTSLKITIAKWLTPSGISINDNGIIPDIAIENTNDDINNNRDPQLQKALEFIKNK